MTKRKISRRQAWRIRKIQEERMKRAERYHQRESELSSDLGPEQEGLLIAHFGKAVSVENAKGELFHCSLRQHIGSIVTGDYVVWREGKDNTGVVVAKKQRKSVLKRPDDKGTSRPVAANIDQIIICSAVQPELSTYLLDSYLVATESLHLTPIVLLNKVDLLTEENQTVIEHQMAVYQDIGYQVLHASTTASHGLDQLETILKEKTSVFVGQSGVGKSSLIQALMPTEKISIGALSEQTGLGRHTTTTARLYHLPAGGDLIDSPGIREFALWHLNREAIAKGFIEFRSFLGQCKFRDCSHQHEPQCALIKAVSDGEIHKHRLENYIKLVTSYQ